MPSGKADLLARYEQGPMTNSEKKQLFDENPAFQEMNENPPPSVVKVHEEMTGKSAAKSVFHAPEQEQMDYIVALLVKHGEQGVRMDRVPHDGSLKLQRMGVVDADRGVLYRKNPGWDRYVRQHHVRVANGDMLQYFADHPDKLREKQMRDKAQKKAYFTVVIPPAKDKAKATQWHGPKTLTRGAFDSKKEADGWAKKNIPRASYSVKEIKSKKALDMLAEMDMDLTEGAIPSVALDRDFAALDEMGRMAAIDHSASKQVAGIILDQMGGSRRLSVMIGARNFISLSNPPGVSFKFMQTDRPSKTGNHCKITLDEGKDLYDIEFGYAHGYKYRVITKLNGVGAEDLTRIFRDQTHLALRLASEQVAMLESRMASEDEDDDDDKKGKFEEGESADPTENMSDEDAKKWRLENLKHKDQFTGKKASSPYRLAMDLLGVSPGDMDSVWVPAVQRFLGNTHRVYATNTVGDVQVLNIEPTRRGDTDAWVLSMAAKFNPLFAFLRRQGLSQRSVNTAIKSVTRHSGDFVNAVKDLKAKGKAASENAAGFDEGSRIPDGWDPGHVEEDPQLGQAEGSDVPDGGGNHTKRGAQPAVQVGEAGMFRHRWPFVYAHGQAEDLLGTDIASFDRAPTSRAWGRFRAFIVAEGATKFPATIFTWLDKGMPAGLVVLKSDRRSMAEAEAAAAAAMVKGGKVAAEEEGATKGGLYGFTKGIQADCESCVRKLQREAHAIAKQAYGKNEKVAEFLSTHARRSDALPAHILVAALKEMGPKVAGAMEKQARLEELRAASGDGKEAGLPRMPAQLLWDKIAQWPRGHSETLTDVTYGTGHLGIHFGRWMKAAEQLAKLGLIEYDDVTITKKAAAKEKKPQIGGSATWNGKKVLIVDTHGYPVKTVDLRWTISGAGGAKDEVSGHKRKVPVSQIKLAATGSGAANAKYLASLPPREKDKILKAVAKHYGVTTSEIEGELTDRDAEALYEYIGNDSALQMQVYRDFQSKRLASDKAAGRSYGLYGHTEKVASLGLQACANVRAASGRIAYDLHKRRAAKHKQITAFLDTHCKTTECKYSSLLAASYPEAEGGGKTWSAPRTVSAWLAWDAD